MRSLVRQVVLALALVSFGAVLLAVSSHTVAQPSSPPKPAASVPTPAPASPPEMTAIRQGVEQISNDIRAIKDELTTLTTNTKRESMLSKLLTDFVSNAIWDFVGFKRSSTTAAGQIASVLGLVFLVVKIAFFFRGRSVSVSSGAARVERVTDVGLVLFLALVIPTLFVMSFSSASGQDAQAEALARQLEKVAEEVGKLRAATNLATTQDIEAARAQLRGIEAALGKRDGAPPDPSDLRAGIAAVAQDVRAVRQAVKDLAASQGGWWGWLFQSGLLLLLAGASVVVILRVSRWRPWF